MSETTDDDEDVVEEGGWLGTVVVTAAAVGVELVGVGLPLDVAAVDSAPAEVLSFRLDSCCRVPSRVVTGDEAREEPVFPFEEPAPPRRIIRSASSSLSIPWRMGRITVRPEKRESGFY